MTEPRKSTKQTDARRRAREKATQFRELQDKLEQLATDYFLFNDSVDETNAETEREIAKLRERAEKQTKKARDDAARVIIRMVDAGAKPDEVAARLGLPVREVRRAIKEATGPTSESTSAPTAMDTEQSEAPGGRRLEPSASVA